MSAKMKRREFITLLGSTTHCISDEPASECQFLLVQGVGKYDRQQSRFAQMTVSKISIAYDRATKIIE
jgi:hypothetical protein